MPCRVSVILCVLFLSQFQGRARRQVRHAAHAQGRGGRARLLRGALRADGREARHRQTSLCANPIERYLYIYIYMYICIYININISIHTYTCTIAPHIFKTSPSISVLLHGALRADGRETSHRKTSLCAHPIEIYLYIYIYAYK